MPASDVIAGVAVAISLISVVAAVLSYRLSKLAERRARMPALVFRRDGGRLVVANVGVGPAMNVIYAQGRTLDPRAEPIALSTGFHEPWFNPIHLAPIEPGGEQCLEPGGDGSVRWEVPRAGLGLRYSDAFGNAYVVKATAHGMRIFEGSRHLPAWSTPGMPYLWHLRNLPPQAPEGPLWWECKPGERPAQPRLDWVD